MLNLLRVLIPDLFALRHSIRWQRMKELAREYRQFPIYSAPREVINALSRGIPVLLLSNYYGIAVAGAYAFGVRMLSVPMGFVQGALRPVLFQKASEIHNRGGGLMVLYARITGGLFLAALVPSAILLMWAPQIFSWVFGTQWHTAGEFARWLVLWLALMLCSLPSTIFAQITRMQRQAFFFDIALIVVRTLSLVVGGMFLSALHTIVVFSVVSSGMNLIWIAIVGVAIVKREGGTNWRRMLSPASKRK
jgi:lipopolysaccharide exporter